MYVYKEKVGYIVRKSHCDAKICKLLNPFFTRIYFITKKKHSFIYLTKCSQSSTSLQSKIRLRSLT